MLIPRTELHQIGSYQIPSQGGLRAGLQGSGHIEIAVADAVHLACRPTCERPMSTGRGGVNRRPCRCVGTAEAPVPRCQNS